jgi:hypothetical protein
MIASLFPSWLTTICTVLGGAVLLILRYFKKKDSPTNQYEQAKSENAKAVTSGNANDLNAILDRNIDRLRDDQTGSGNP